MSDSSIGYPVGKKTRLIPIDRERHFEKCLAWVNDPTVTQFLLRYRPVTREEEQLWFDNLKDRKDDIIFGIETLDGEFIGTTGLHRIDWRNGTATTGTMIGNQDYWGKGYGSDAKMLLLQYAFVTAGLRRVCSRVLDFNTRSLRCQLKCGYKEEGRLRQHVYRNGTFCDEIHLGVFAHEWRERWELYSST